MEWNRLAGDAHKLGITEGFVGYVRCLGLLGRVGIARRFAQQLSVVVQQERRRGVDESIFYSSA